MNKKQSRYVAAGPPLSCFLPSCQKPFLGSCIRVTDGHFYCSNVCADQGKKNDLSRAQSPTPLVPTSARVECDIGTDPHNGKPCAVNVSVLD